MSSADPGLEEVVRLRRCLNDLIGIMALPTLWAGGEPKQIANILLDALLGMLPLVLAFVRLDDPLGGPTTEFIRLAESLEGLIEAREMSEVLNASFGPFNWPPTARVSIKGTDLCVAHTQLGLEGELGLVVVGSQRSGFPEQAWINFLTLFTPPRAAVWASDCLSAAQLSRDIRAVCGRNAMRGQVLHSRFLSLVGQKAFRWRLPQRGLHDGRAFPSIGRRRR